MTETHWYGWQTLASDGASWLVAMVGSMFQDKQIRNSFLYASGAGFVAGAPIIHWSHGHASKGILSLWMRLVPPLVIISLRERGENFPIPAIEFLLMGAWIPATIAIDSAALAQEKIPKSGVSFVPLVTPARGGGTLGLGGSF